MGRGFNPRGRGRGRGGFRGRGGGKRTRSDRGEAGPAEHDGQGRSAAAKRGRGGYHSSKREEPVVHNDPLRNIFAEHDEEGECSHAQGTSMARGDSGSRQPSRTGAGTGARTGARGNAYALLMQSFGSGAAGGSSKRRRASSASSDESDDDEEDEDEEEEEESDGEEGSGSGEGEESSMDDDSEGSSSAESSHSDSSGEEGSQPAPVPAPTSLATPGSSEGAGVPQQQQQPDTFASLFLVDPLAGLEAGQEVAWLHSCRSSLAPLAQGLAVPSTTLGCGAEGSIPPLGIESLTLLISGAGGAGAAAAAASGSAGTGGGTADVMRGKGLLKGKGEVAPVQRPGWDSSALRGACRHLAPPPLSAGEEEEEGEGGEERRLLALACDPTGAHPHAALLRRSALHAAPGAGSGSGFVPLPAPFGGLESHWHVRPKIAQAWARAYGGEMHALLQGAYEHAYRSSAGGKGELVTALAHALTRTGGYPFTPLQSVLWPALHAHADVYFPARTQANARELRTLTCLHVATHVSRARQAVEAHTQWLKEQALKHRQAKLARASGGTDAEAAAAGGAGGEGSGSEDEKARAGEGAGAEGGAQSYDETSLRDQGFTRPRVLILLPTRHACLQYVRTLLRILAPEREGGGPGQGAAAGEGAQGGAGGAAGAVGGGGWVSVSNRNRFFREFMEDEDEGGGAGEAGGPAAGQPRAHNSGTRSRRDEAEDEADTAAEKDLRAGRTGAPAVLRLLAKRRKQMMSDDEAEDRPALLSSGAAAAGAGAGPVLSSYPFALGRQGWPPGLLARSRREKMSAEGLLPMRTQGAEEADPAPGPGPGPSVHTAHRGEARGPKKGKNEARRRDKAETIGDNIQALEEAQKRAERDARRAAKAAERASRLAAAADASGTGGSGSGGSSMPADYNATFRGNIDDDFRIGLSVGRKTVSLYSDFYRSDVLLCSPLGLRRILGGEGDREKDRDSDFLSSLEIVVLDGAEHMLMQNWQHVRDVFARANVTPSKPRPDTDFSRVRESVLAGNGKLTRQTILYATHAEPDFSALLRRACSNVVGTCAFVPRYGGSGQLARVHVPVRQVFQRVPGVASLASADEARFTYFKDRLLPDLLSESASASAGPGGATVLSGATHTGVCVYVPSYYDYVRLRNCLDAHSAEFVTLTEYTEEKDVKRARSRFAAGDSPILVLTERFLFFRRLRIRGIRHLLFYAPPAVGAHYYPELLHQLQEASMGGGAGSVSSTVLFTRYDAAALDRLVGSDTAARMLGDAGEASSKNTFVFV